MFPPQITEPYLGHAITGIVNKINNLMFLLYGVRECYMWYI